MVNTNKTVKSTTVKTSTSNNNVKGTVTTVQPNVTVTPQTVQVKVVTVKPQIVYVKRLVHKYLVTNGINHSNSTVTKPQIKNGCTQQQITGVQNYLNGLLQNITTGSYNYTTPQQVQYITNHFVTHSNKYLK